MPFDFETWEAASAILDTHVANAKGYLKQGFLRRASAELSDAVGDLAALAEATDGLLSEDAPPVAASPPPPPSPMQSLTLNSGSIQSCMRGAHSFGPADEFGRAECTGCGMVNVQPPAS